MELLIVLATVVAVVVPLLVAGAALLIPRAQFRHATGEWRGRAIEAFPYVAALGGILLFNDWFRPVAHDISWWIGIEATHWVVRIEGDAVAQLQQFIGGDAAIIFFSFMYVYGYVFLLVFPFVAYFVLERLNAFKSLSIAYMLNYGVGLGFYTAFVVFGPRNAIPELVDQPMYVYYPQLQLLTSAVNEYTNVFPSLHTSLSATVMLFAWHTRTVYRRWVPVAFFIGGSVIFATMYLAIHWIVDVVAGVGLAVFSYWFAVHAVENRWFESTAVARAWRRMRDAAR